MPKPLKDSRIGVYKCSIVNGFVSKVKGGYVRGDYVGVFTWDDLIFRIIPDLRQYRLKGSEYPILITSWRLQEGDPSKPLPMPISTKKLTMKSAGGLRNAKRIMGLPIRRKKNPHTETWEAVVYDTGQAIKVIGVRIMPICPICHGDLEKPTGSILIVEFSPVGAKVRESHDANVYRCVPCKTDIVFVAKETNIVAVVK